jgi:hypothetical protein
MELLFYEGDGGGKILWHVYFLCLLERKLYQTNLIHNKQIISGDMKKKNLSTQKAWNL